VVYYYCPCCKALGTLSLLPCIVVHAILCVREVDGPFPVAVFDDVYSIMEHLALSFAYELIYIHKQMDIIKAKQS
jgi:hypothetical protein